MSISNLRTRELTEALTSGRAKLWVLLIGVNHYQDPQFAPLHYSAADCRGLEEALLAAAYEFPQKHILTRHDFAAQPSTLAVVQADLTQIVSNAKPQDTVLFYFSGHGVLDSETKQAVLCLSDTHQGRLLATGLRMHDLMYSLSVCEARQQIVWLDACHSGELLAQGAKGQIKAASSTEPTAHILDALRLRAAQSKGFYALLSCDQGQRSWEFPELGHGLFTHYLIRGLQGEAADAEGVISMDGLYRYVYQQTIEFINQKNQQLRQLNQQKRQNGDYLLHPEYPLQTPKRIVDGVGELVLGLKPEKVIAHFLQSATPDAARSETPLETNTAEPVSHSSRRSHLLLNFLSDQFRHLFSNSFSDLSPKLFLGLIAIGSIAVLILGAMLLPSLRSTHDQTPTVESKNDAQITDAEACNIQVTPAGLQSNEMAFRDGQIILSPCQANNSWRQVTAQAILTTKPVWKAIFMPDGKTLVTAGGRVGEIWDLQTRQPTHTLGGHTDWVYAAAISPDGKTLATASADRTIRLWDVTTGTLLHKLTGHRAAIWSVAISPDGKTLASGSADHTVKLWDLQTGKLRQTLAGHNNWVFAVAFSPTQPLLASASQDTTIKLWDLQTGELIRTLSGHENTVRALAFAPNGQQLASTSWDQTVRLWQIPSGKPLQTFTGHRDRVIAAAFAPDGQTLASSSYDQTIKLWTPTSPTAIATFHGHTDWILSIAFSPEGKTLASGSRNQTLILWHH